MTSRRAALLAACLLLSIVLSLLTGCAAEPAEDVAAEMLDYVVAFGVLELTEGQDPAEITRLRSTRWFQRGDDGELYYVVRMDSDTGETRVRRMSRPAQLPEDDSGRY